MAEFSSHAAGSPCWVDLMSPDVDGAKAFYSAVFGWDTTDETDPDGNVAYTLFTLGGKNVTGVGAQSPEMRGMPALWNTYIATEDVEATSRAVTGAGGSVVTPAMQVMEAGHMAGYLDPTGAAFSVWQAANHTGAQVTNDPNTYAWNELATSDPDTAMAFYSKVFGWEFEGQDMGPMGTYYVIKGGENGGWGGLMAKPAEMPVEVPDHWMVYFTVADIGASVDLVAANGGQVVAPVMDVPGVGQMAVVHDPANGTFSVMQPAAM